VVSDEWLRIPAQRAEGCPVPKALQRSGVEGRPRRTKPPRQFIGRDVVSRFVLFAYRIISMACEVSEIDLPGGDILLAVAQMGAVRCSPSSSAEQATAISSEWWESCSMGPGRDVSVRLAQRIWGSATARHDRMAPTVPRGSLHLSSPASPDYLTRKANIGGC
jgi:hypothetical protein